MRVRILRNLGSLDWPEYPWLQGEVREVDEALGARLLAAGLAEEVVDVVEVDPAKASQAASVSEAARAALLASLEEPWG